MNRVVPWTALVELISLHAPEGRKGRPPFPVESMLRIHFMQQWFTLNQSHHGMKAHIGVDAESGLVHTVRCTAGNVNDVIEANSLLHGQEAEALRCRLPRG